jgi:hypothetical protein
MPRMISKNIKVIKAIIASEVNKKSNVSIN